MTLTTSIGNIIDRSLARDVALSLCLFANADVLKSDSFLSLPASDSDVLKQCQQMITVEDVLLDG